MTRPARNPDAPARPAASGAVLVAADHAQRLIWVRLEGEDKFAIAFEPAQARDLAGAIGRAADELEVRTRVDGGLSVC